MGKQFDPWDSGSRTRLHEDFVSGMSHFKGEDYQGAIPLFRAADEGADMDDIYQHRYTSFHGLARVMMGDKAGVKLCRKAAVGEKDYRLFKCRACGARLCLYGLRDDRFGTKPLARAKIHGSSAVWPSHGGAHESVTLLFYVFCVYVYLQGFALYDCQFQLSPRRRDYRRNVLASGWYGLCGLCGRHRTV